MKKLVMLLAITLFFVLPGVVLAEENGLTAEESAAEPTLTLNRMVLCTGVVDREPIDEVASFSIDSPKAYAFLDVAASEPAQLTVVWSYNGEEVAEVPLNVGKSNRWRTYSSKNLARLAGDWAVEVRNPAGEPLASTAFKVQ